jgi:hypothetical protein
VQKHEGEKRIAMKFDNAAWKDALAWHSDQTGLSFVSEHRPPPGSFSHATPNAVGDLCLRASNSLSCPALLNEWLTFSLIPWRFTFNQRPPSAFNRPVVPA